MNEKVTMTRDLLRAVYLKKIDDALAAPWPWSREFSDEDRKLLHVQRDYWRTAPDAEMDRLLGLYNGEP